MSKVKAIGEIALRVNDLKSMVDFYTNIVGLTPMRIEKNFAFFNIAEGHEGHTQVLAMFDRSERTGIVPIDRARTTVDHIAFNLSLVDLESEKNRLESLGQEVTTGLHAWVKWKSIYFVDPEGNSVEFVCYDESMKNGD